MTDQIELRTQKSEVQNAGSLAPADLGYMPALHKSILLKKDSSVASDLIDGLADGAYKQPLKAISQLMGKPEEKTPEIAAAPESGSHKVGQIVGSLVPFVALSTITRAASVRLLGAELTPSLLRSVGEQASTGFLMGSLLTPSQLKPGENILTARLEQGGTSGLTFGSMALSANLLNRVLPEANAPFALASRRLGIAALSGASGGIVDVEAKTGFKANFGEVGSSALGFAIFGVTMEGGGMIAKSLFSGQSAEQALPQNRNDSVSPEHENNESANRLLQSLQRDREAALSTETPEMRTSAQDLAELHRRFVGDSAPVAEKVAQKILPLEGKLQELNREPAETARPFAETANPSAESSTSADQIRSAAEHPVVVEIAQKALEVSSDPSLPVRIARQSEKATDLNLVPKEQLPFAREQLLDELKNFEGGAKQGKMFELYSSLMDTNWLSDAQKIRLTDVIVQVRDYYANLNNSESGVASKAQRSWALSQASLAEVINDALIAAKDGKEPGAQALENKILTSLFSQFRLHRDEPYSNITRDTMMDDREAGAQKILETIGYSQEQINGVVGDVRNTSLAAQPTDLVRFDESKLQTFEPVQLNNKLQRDPILSSELPISQDWKNPTGKSYENRISGSTISKWSNEAGAGELIRDKNGVSTVTNQSDGSKFTYGATGKILQANHVVERSFSYDKSGNLNRIESAPTDLATLVLKRGSWYAEQGQQPDGSPTLQKVWDGKVVADDNGSVRFIAKDLSQVKEFGIDGTDTVHYEQGRPVITMADYQYEQTRLMDKIENTFSEKGRLERMDNLVKAFESEGSARGLTNNDKALFYKQMNRLLTEGSDSALPIIDRRDLAEQAIHHAAYPTTIDQGGNNTCNVTTVENRVYTRAPKDMAQMLADIADTGTYTTHSGDTIDLKTSITGLKPDYEARASRTIQQDLENGEGAVKNDGDRDWASQLAQLVMVKIKHLTTTEFIAKDTIVDDQNLVFDQSGKLIGKVAEKDIYELLDKHGHYTSTIPADGLVFRKDGRYIEPVSHSDLVFDQNGEVKGSVIDSQRIQKLYDYFGNEFKSLEPGSNYFDQNGKLVMYQTVPGDITYDKLQTKPTSPFLPTGEQEPPEEFERMNARHLGKDVLLKEESNGKVELVDSPSLPLSGLGPIEQEVTGLKSPLFTIWGGRGYAELPTTLKVGTSAQLEAALIKMKDDGNLPGIIMVHTSKAPWGANQRGGWHVVNYQDYDSATGLVKMTNQWGSNSDFMETGVPVWQLFDSMFPR